MFAFHFPAHEHSERQSLWPEIDDIDRAREIFAKRLMVNIDHKQVSNGFVQSLQSVLNPFRQGHCPVYVVYENAGAAAQIKLGQDWLVKPTDELINRLKALAGEQQIKVEY